ncbi:ADAM 17-like protease isoform X2 [Anneissia japonica]|uniref:ADAM 17-like protease isoform X2 n=1 Tax=Anneissia japonica TaxID=1529436 RepID=UPI0014254DC7|nr:ADAM 17-like protease isoform X2 [Anneissia japonica]
MTRIYIFGLYTFILFIFFLSGSQGSLHHALHYYDTLHIDNVKHHIVKRDLDEDDQHVRYISFTTLGRKFDLELRPSETVLSSTFKAYAVDEHGKKEEYEFDRDNVLSGHLTDDFDSHVQCHIEDDNTLNAKIVTQEETYIIEPSWRHLTDTVNGTMISYRKSDRKSNDTHTYCGHGSHLPKGLKYDRDLEEEEHHHYTKQYQESDGHGRQRRSLRPPPKHVCPLLLTADSLFYVNMGQSSMSQTINYLISLVDRVNLIYKRTNWDGKSYGGFYFEVAEVTVHKTQIMGNHYNTKPPIGDVWEVQDLLEMYSKQNHMKFCLAHLFTYQDFSSGVLGLAYIGTQRTNAVGGICTQSYPSNGGDLYLNTGLTTTLNWGRRVLTDEAELVTAHELGHNFGSEHDPTTNINGCAPDDPNGNFLMYPASVSGKKPNHDRFSPCSKRMIQQVLKAKSSRCFREPQGTNVCGNYRIDKNEQCDAGLLAQGESDPCCHLKCKLKPGKKCSDKNSPCCEGCRFAPPTKACRETEYSDTGCKKAAFCTGQHANCPRAEFKQDGSPCIENGRCMNGVCMPFCEVNGLVSCICSDSTESCYWCCKRTEADDCTIYINSTLKQPQRVPDGRPCNHGVCKKGKCETQAQDFIERFFDIFEGITISKLGRIIKDNIVGATIIISLIIWIPCSCLVHYVDKKREKEISEDNDWFNPTNKELMRPGDKGKVRRSQVIAQEAEQDSNLFLTWLKGSEGGKENSTSSPQEPTEDYSTYLGDADL